MNNGQKEQLQTDARHRQGCTPKGKRAKDTTTKQQNLQLKQAQPNSHTTQKGKKKKKKPTTAKQFNLVNY